MQVGVLVNYEIPSLNTSPTLNLVQSYIFFPKLVSSLSIMSFSLMSMFLFLLKKIHWSWIYLYIVIDAYMYLRMELCVRGYNFWQYVWTVLLMYIYVCLYLLWKGGMQEWGFISCKEFYLNRSLWRVICCNDQCTNSFIFLVFMMCVWCYSAWEIVYNVHNTLNAL